MGPEKVQQPTHKKTRVSNGPELRAKAQTDPQSADHASERDLRQVPNPNSKTITVGKMARRLKVPKLVNSYLLLDKVVPDAARVPEKSDINDFEDFLLAMRAGQRLTKEKFLASRDGSAEPMQAQGNKRVVAARSIKNTGRLLGHMKMQKGDTDYRLMTQLQLGHYNPCS
jgi:hypothetical protein